MGIGDALVRVEEARLLDDAPTFLDKRDLTGNLVIEGSLDVTERVQVLEFCPGAQDIVSLLAHRHIGVAAKAPFLHVAVAYFEIHENVAQRLEICRRFFRGPQVGFAHDLEERGARTVVVDHAVAACLDGAFVDELARILFHVDAQDTDTFCFSVHDDIKPSVIADGLFVL